MSCTFWIMNRLISDYIPTLQGIIQMQSEILHPLVFDFASEYWCFPYQYRHHFSIKAENRKILLFSSSLWDFIGMTENGWDLRFGRIKMSLESIVYSIFLSWTRTLFLSQERKFIFDVLAYSPFNSYTRLCTTQ